MKRDMDLVRAILLHVEGADEETLSRGWLVLDGYDAPTIARHVEMMREAGLVDAHVVRGDGVPPQAARVFRMTWAGHDFLDATRNETVWAKTKQFVAEKGGSVSFELLKAVAVQFSLAHFGLHSG